MTVAKGIGGGGSPARGRAMSGRKQLHLNLSAAVIDLAEMALVSDAVRWSPSSLGNSAS
jgi:hypothetical protein